MRLTQMVRIKDVSCCSKLDELKWYLFRTYHITVHLPGQTVCNEATLERWQNTPCPQV